MPRFVLFGADHLAALLVLALGGGVLVFVGRRLGPQAQVWDRWIRAGLAAWLVAGLALHLGDTAARRGLRVWDLLPLHLCDLSIFLCLWTLATSKGRRLLLEVAFLWTVTGTVLATVTPALRAGFPTLRFLTYFMLHGGVIWVSLYFVVGRRVGLSDGARWRVWFFTLAYAAGVGLIDVFSGRNYLYLLRKPPGPTLLDPMGPWPIYIGVVSVLALVLFTIVEGLARAAGLVSRRTPGAG